MNGRTKLVPSIADILFTVIFIKLVFFSGGTLLVDGDTGYHIRAGEFIIDTFSVPDRDIFSFLSPPLAWTAHEWLSEVIMASVHSAFGLTGIVIFFSFLIAFIFSLLFKMVRTSGSNMVAVVVIMLLVIGSSQVHWLARPHIFLLLLTVVWYRLLDSYQYDDRNHLYFLPPLMLLWVNLHGGFILGLVLVAVYLVGNIVGSMVSTDDGKQRCARKARALALTMLACILVSMINPYGPRILLFPLELTSNKLIMDSIVEFQSPNFHVFRPFAYLILFTVATFALSRTSLNIIEVILAVLFVNMALYSTRHIPLFGIVVAPILARQTELILNQRKGMLVGFLKKRSEGIASMDASSRWHLWPVAACLAAVVLFAAGRIEYGFDEKKMPVEAVGFLKREKIEGNMFNNDEFGDYIIYAAWPGYRVFFDGRSDMYGAQRLKEYLSVRGIAPGWERVLEKYGISWVIFNARSPLSQHLLERPDWRLIYADRVAVIFVRNTEEYEALIERYGDARPVVGGGEDDQE